MDTETDQSRAKRVGLTTRSYRCIRNEMVGDIPDTAAGFAKAAAALKPKYGKIQNLGRVSKAEIRSWLASHNLSALWAR